MQAYNRYQKRTPLLLWPFKLIWELVALILNLTGRLVGVMLGLVLMIVGLVLSLTIVGAIVGIPVLFLGFLVLLRSLF